MRRMPNGEIKYYLSNAPKDLTLKKTVWLLSLRWTIEQCFKEGKSELGMDDYELRSWPGWHRHMLYVFLTMLFLLEVRFEFKKRETGSDFTPGQTSSCRRSTAKAHH